MAQMKKKAAKKADPMKSSAASHQRDLAKTSGMTQANNAAATPGRPRRAGTLGVYKKAQAETLKSFGLSTTKAKATTKPAAKPAARSKAGADVVQDITNRFRVTAREARDIVTAVSSAAGLALDKNAYSSEREGTTKAGEVGKAVKNIGKQIKETATAAKTGKKGTTGGFKGTRVGEYPYIYVEGKKRK